MSRMREKGNSVSAESDDKVAGRIRQLVRDKGSSLEEYLDQMTLFLDPLVDGWKSDDLMLEMVLKEAGFQLDYHVERAEKVRAQNVFRVSDKNSSRPFYICLDCEVRLENLEPLEPTSETRMISRAGSVNDGTAANLATRCMQRLI